MSTTKPPEKKPSPNFSGNPQNKTTARSTEYGAPGKVEEQKPAGIEHPSTPLEDKSAEFEPAPDGGLGPGSSRWIPASSSSTAVGYSSSFGVFREHGGFLEASIFSGIMCVVGSIIAFSREQDDYSRPPREGLAHGYPMYYAPHLSFIHHQDLAPLDTR